MQELRAKRTLDRLRLRLRLWLPLHRARCRVLRDGQEREVAPDEVVQGDLLVLAAGDQVVVGGRWWAPLGSAGESARRSGWRRALQPSTVTR